MSTEATAPVYFQPGPRAGLGLRLLTATARDSGGHPVAGVTLVFSIAEGPGALGDGDEQLVLLRTDAQGHARCYWYPVVQRDQPPDDVRQALIHVRCDDLTVESIDVETSS